MIKVNEYFGGQVKSLGYASSEGKATIGVMDEGEYQFGTSLAETILVIQRQLTVLLPGEQTWKTFVNGLCFDVSANVTFSVKSKGQTSYLYTYQ
jgi:hypothetical protein